MPYDIRYALALMFEEPTCQGSQLRFVHHGHHIVLVQHGTVTANTMSANQLKELANIQSLKL